MHKQVLATLPRDGEPHDRKRAPVALVPAAWVRQGVTEIRVNGLIMADVDRYGFTVSQASFATSPLVQTSVPLPPFS